MAIKGFDEDTFRKVIRTHLTPAQAISTPEHLKGRTLKLKEIDRALNSPGMHIFIFGDRGVGKTSLAQTAANIRQISNQKPVLVSCQSGRLFDIIKDAVRMAIPDNPHLTKLSSEHRFRFTVGALGYEFTRSLANGSVPEIQSTNEAVSLLTCVAELRGSEIVFVFDEFDQITHDEERKKCADLIMSVSNSRVGVKFIFCGIGQSIEELFGTHMSAARYLTPIQLEPLSHDARWEIVKDASAALGIDVEYRHLLRIGQISDGFPSYVHLICEQMFWAAFDDVQNISVCHQGHFESGVNGALNRTEVTLRMIYEKATQKYSDDYQEVLWALADDALLRRQITDVYEKSYRRIMNERPGRTTLTKDQFYGRMRNLTTERHGKILLSKGAGWYQFRENVVRGYVRLRAQKQGIELGKEGHV
jgi:hypothetical protein